MAHDFRAISFRAEIIESLKISYSVDLNKIVNKLGLPRLTPKLLSAVCLITLSFCAVIPAQTKISVENQTGKTLPGSSDMDELRREAFQDLRNGLWTSSKAKFHVLTEKQPDDTLSLYGLSLAAFNLQETQTAKVQIDKVIDILNKNRTNDPLLADCYVLSAVIAANQKQNESAVETLEKAISLVPDHFDANFSLARAYFGNGDLTKATRYFERSVEIQPENIRARFYLASTFEKLGNSGGALAAYREIIRLEPGSIQGYLGLGVLLLKEKGGNSPEGIAALERVLETNGEIYEARIGLGKALVQKENYREALVHLKKAAELVTDNPEPHYQLALAYQKLGMKSEAKAEMEIVKRIHSLRRLRN